MPELETVVPLRLHGPLDTENEIVSKVLPPDIEILVVSPRMKLLAVITSASCVALLNVKVTLELFAAR